MRKSITLLLIVLVGLFFVACGGSSQEVATSEPADTTEETAPEEAAPEEGEAEEAAPEEDAEAAPEAAGDSFLARAMAGEFAGNEVTVFGKWTEGEGANFEEVLAAFSDATGINVQYEGSAEFETLITVRAEAGDTPDIAGFPQPALMAEFVKQGLTKEHWQLACPPMIINGVKRAIRSRWWTCGKLVKRNIQNSRGALRAARGCAIMVGHGRGAGVPGR